MEQSSGESVSTKSEKSVVNGMHILVVDDIRDALGGRNGCPVAKPIVLDQLERTIREVLERKGRQKCDLNI